METPFDKSLQIESLLWIKLFIPYLPPDTQRMMAIYVRFAELQHTFSSFHVFQRTSHDPMDMFQEMRPFMSPSVSETFDNLMNMMSMMEMMKDMEPDPQEMFEMFNSMNAGGETDVGLDE